MRLAVLILFSVWTPAETIDRIAVTVDKRVITESEILRQIRITAFLNDASIDTSPARDTSPASKRATADRLVEQVLIRRELETSGYAPSASGATATHEELKKRFPTENDYQRALARYGISDADARGALEWQATLLDFIDLRFRPGIQISETELRDYYDQQAGRNPGKLPRFEEARGDIETILTAQRVDNAVDRWLGQARTQTQIRYKQEVFR